MHVYIYFFLCQKITYCYSLIIITDNLLSFTIYIFFRACDIPGFETQSELYVWLSVCDVVVRMCSTPVLLSYRTVDTYAQHGADLMHRLTMENCMSHFSSITWSRQDIYKRPTQVELRRGLVQAVNVFNPVETGFFDTNLIDLASITLGSFQPRQGIIAYNLKDFIIS